MQPAPALHLERDRKYAWDYFQLHSSQRIATFNFYITLATALLSGISVALQPSVSLPLIGLVLSALLSLVSFSFWKLDGRNKMLIKLSEEALKEIEQSLEDPQNAAPPAASLFRRDEQRVRARRTKTSLLFWRNHYSYSNCFNLVFAIFGIGGGIGIILSLVSLY